MSLWTIVGGEVLAPPSCRSAAGRQQRGRAWVPVAGPLLGAVLAGALSHVSL